MNGLKKINDTLGHKAGDEYIRAACDMLCEYFKHSPVYRVGGLMYERKMQLKSLGAVTRD